MTKRPQDTFKIAIVVSRFNRVITDALLEGTQIQLHELGVLHDQISVYPVPGAIEIPFIVNKIATLKRHEAIIALGAVIRGETSHYDLVCNQVSFGCQSVSLKLKVPVIFGVLTVENELQAWDRLGGQKGHKGQEAARCALEMIALVKKIQNDCFS